MEVDFAVLELRIEQFRMANDTVVPVAGRADLMTLKRIAVADDPRRKTGKADLKALEALEPRRAPRPTRR